MAPRKKRKQADIYTSEQVDDICAKFEKCMERLRANQSSVVRRNAAEKDLLKCAEQVRDLLHIAVLGDKPKLDDVFGGSCRRFHRLNNARKGEVDLNPGNQEDTRWQDMEQELDEVEQILRQLDSFAPWVETTAPAGLAFGEIPEWLDDIAEVCFMPMVEGTDVETLSYRIHPPLPQGLKLHRGMGTISGRPAENSAASTLTTYTVSAENAVGSCTTTITFGVKAAAPEALEYEVCNLVMVGTPILWAPKAAGGRLLKFEVDQELPKGLSLNPTTGVISGTPLQRTDEDEYVITGSNMSGSVTVCIEMEVKSAPPVSIHFQDVQGCDFNIGVNLYVMPEVEMQAPDGGKRKIDLGCQPRRTLATSFGRVMSDDLDQAPQAALLVMAEAEQLEQPGVSFVSSAMTTSRGTMFPIVAPGTRLSVNVPSWDRGHSESGAFVGTRWTRRRKTQWEVNMAQGMRPDILFSVSPELPAGLSISKTTGVINGRPTETAPRRAYKVVASNESGECSTILNFGIINVAPKALHYPDVKDTMFEGQAVTFSPEVDGVVTRWSVSPDLPPGIQCDEFLGTISGVPRSTCPATTWTVTAQNEAGEVSTFLTFRVKVEKPDRLSYTPNNAYYPWETYLKMIPQCFSKGGRPASVEEYTVSPDLPSGLVLDSKTGLISGRPLEITPQTSYSISAANESGSCTGWVTFEIKEIPPHELHYSHLDDYYCISERMDECPSVVGGATSWAIEPELPLGMQLDANTGKIFGVPEEISPETEYTIVASNNIGCTSSVITVTIVAPAPTKLAYPEFGWRVWIGHSVCFDPIVTPSSAGATFTVEPELPNGLRLCEADGQITGEPLEPVEKRDYVVTATNKVGSVSCSLHFECLAPQSDPMMVDQDFAAKLMEVTDLSALPEAPCKTNNMADWMIWMVHRAWLNDPKLTHFDFSNMHMLLPMEEPRIAPKLTTALLTNTHITTLLLAGSNLRNPQASVLGEVLKVNTCLEVINIESNWVDADGVLAIARALKEHKSSSVTTWRFSNQRRGDNFGRPVEEAIAEMLAKNDRITKVGFTPQDPHWNSQISQLLRKNADVARRHRKQAQGVPEQASLAPPEVKSLAKVVLDTTPEKAVWEIFDDDDVKFRLLRRYISEQRRMPTREQLQSYAKMQGEKLTYGKVAPILKQFRTGVFKNILGKDITCWDEDNVSYTGSLNTFVERNDRMHLDVSGNPTGHWEFRSTKAPVIEASDDVAEWLFDDEPHSDEEPP